MSGPVFLFTMHRSGGTALARALNRHPDLMVWGEHAGIINKLAELDAMMGHYPRVVQPLADRHLAEEVAARKFDPDGFEAWTSPVELGAYRVWCRTYLDSTFRRHLHPGQRWGFKEVRYHSLTTARFLLTLFPEGRFVLLRRDLSALVLSNMLAPWSIGRLRQLGATESEAEVRAAVHDCAYALAAVDRGFSDIQQALPEHARTIWHDALRTPATTYPPLLDFLRLSHWPALIEEIVETSQRRLGETNPNWQAGHLTREAVQRLIPEALIRAEADLAANGPDLGRLKRLAATGRYSFLAGDHELIGTPYSTMF